MRRIGKDKIILGCVAVFAVFIVLAVFVAIQIQSPQNKVYLVPQHSNATYSNTTGVEIWVNTKNFQSGQINLTYNLSCANVTNWERKTATFTAGGWDSSMAGREWITFLAISPLTGEYKIGTLTIYCISDSKCTTDLDFVNSSALFNDTGNESPIDWIDGSFKCDKDVW